MAGPVFDYFKKNASLLVLAGFMLWLFYSLPDKQNGLYLLVEADSLSLGPEAPITANQPLMFDDDSFKTAVVTSLIPVSNSDPAMIYLVVRDFPDDWKNLRWITYPQRAFIHASKPSPLYPEIYSYLQVEGDTLLWAFLRTFAVALATSSLILMVCLLLVGLVYRHPAFGKLVSLGLGFACLLPSVYLVILLKTSFGYGHFDNALASILILAFSNLLCFFFFKQYRDEILEEFAKPYQDFHRQLGIRNIWLSSLRKLVLISLERFRSLFVLVFSCSVFVEFQLMAQRGIYSHLYQSLFSGGSRLVTISMLFLILWGSILFLLFYDAMAAWLRARLI